MASKFRPNDGDWTCPDSSCGNVNFARRDACNRCGKPKEESRPKVKKLGVEIGKDAAEKSKGLFSADDWMCTKCGNVNWARRSTCNVCNAPRFGEVEERTGYGGGYNERGNVEYKERTESDDEFDEFGRIKKKFRGKNSVSEPSTSAKQTDHEGEESYKNNDDDVDDDNDEDEEDLSKYDLSGWGDEGDEDLKKSTESSRNTNNDNASSKNESEPRSRSRDDKRSRSSSRSSSSRSRRRSRSRSSRSRSRSRNRHAGRRSERHRRRSRSSSKSSLNRSRSRSRSRDRRRRR